MRKDWPWIGIGACLGVLLSIFLFTELGFHYGRTSYANAILIVIFIIGNVMQVGIQLNWKTTSGPEDDLWNQGNSDDVAKARIFWGIGIFLLYLAMADLGFWLATYPHHMLKSAIEDTGLLVIAHGLLGSIRRFAGRKRAVAATPPEP
jgi:hypothetical protein